MLLLSHSLNGVHLTTTYSIWQQLRRRSTKMILGIESTFDDTGASVVDSNGNILGEALNVQDKEHVVTGGVDPRVAQISHRKFLPLIAEEAMEKAKVSFKELSAVATATRPGLPYCLAEGLLFSQGLVQKHGLPFIPVHHMEAHLLTPRMISEIEFPFLTLLASGGHCILCIAHKLGHYEILGESLDEPPGAVFDKVARELRILERHEDGRRSSGRDLEEFAKLGDYRKIPITTPFARKPKRSCDFSFAGLQTQAIVDFSQNSDHKDVDVAAWFQHCAILHILKRVHRGILFCQQMKLFDKQKPTLIASGGVTCNSVLRAGLLNLCEMTSVNLVTPPLHLCTDNGSMIAWAGMEYLLQGRGISNDPMSERYKPKSPLGRNISCQVEKLHIPVPRQNYFINNCGKI